MSSQAGAVNSNDGVGLFGVSVTPLEGLKIDVSNQYGVNTFNTIYAEGQYLLPLNEDWKLRFGAQITDQRAVGDALLAPGNGRFWVTQVGGTRLEAFYRQLTLTAAFSVTGSGNNIQNPWGTYPGYLSMIELRLQPRPGDRGAGRRRLRLLAVAHPRPERQRQPRVGLECHQSDHTQECPEPGRIRRHRRLSPALQSACPPGHVGPLPLRRHRSAAMPRRSGTSSASSSTGTGT